MNASMSLRAWRATPAAAFLRSRPTSSLGASLRRGAASRPATSAPLQRRPLPVDLSLQATAQADRGSLLIVGGLVLGFGAYALSNDRNLSSGSIFYKPIRLDSAVPAAMAKPNERVDPSTALAFPLTLAPKSLSSSLALVGLGVRTVSFLRVKVYSAGFYVPEGKDGRWGTDGMGEEAAMASFLKDGASCAMRIVPARNTDFAHLRDGLVRAVQGRLKLLTKAGQLTEEEAERAAGSLNDFKTFFPSRSAAKGSELVLVKLPANAGLAVEFEGQVLGTLDDPIVGREVFASYFLDGGKEISPKLKQSIVEGYQNRPQ